MCRYRFVYIPFQRADSCLPVEYGQAEWQVERLLEPGPVLSQGLHLEYTRKRNLTIIYFGLFLIPVKS